MPSKSAPHLVMIGYYRGRQLARHPLLVTCSRCKALIEAARAQRAVDTIHGTGADQC